MPSTNPELTLGTDTTAAAAAFADIVLNDNIPFAGTMPGVTLFGLTPGDVPNSNDASFSASSWETDDMLDAVELYSTTVVKTEPIDTDFPLVATSAAAQPLASLPPLSLLLPVTSATSTTTIAAMATGASTAAAAAAAAATAAAAAAALKRQREIRFAVVNAKHGVNDDEDDEDAEDDEDEDHGATAANDDADEDVDELMARHENSEAPMMLSDSSTPSTRSKKVPKKSTASAPSSETKPVARRAGRPPRAASAAVAALTANAALDSDDFSDSESPKSKSKAGAKRKAATQHAPLTKAEQELAATLELTRDELLNMTSDSLEIYAQRLASSRPLTVDEQKRFKRQRRLIKNRESAQLSRMRKKAYVDELEKQIAALNEDKEKLRRRYDSQARELDSTKAQVTYLRSLLSSHPALAQLADRGAPAPPSLAAPTCRPL